MTSLIRQFIPVLVGLAVAAGGAAPVTAQGQAGEQRRDEWQKVDEIFDAMLVRPGAVVADVGAGDGYFTTRLSRAVGPDGRVLAVDIGDRALNRLRQRIDDDRLGNVEVIEGAVDDPKLPEGGVDAILIVNAYHEMTEHQAMLARMKAALKPGGRLVIVEPIAPARRDRPRGEQTKNHEIGIDFVKAEATAAGFVQVSMQDPFTTRQHAHGGRSDEEWMLVLTPGNAQSEITRAWSASRQGWQAADLRLSIDAFKALAARSDVLLLDVRDQGMYRAGHLPGAVLMTPEEILTPEGIATLREERRPIVAYCS